MLILAIIFYILAILDAIILFCGVILLSDHSKVQDICFTTGIILGIITILSAIITIISIFIT